KCGVSPKEAQAAGANASLRSLKQLHETALAIPPGSEERRAYSWALCAQFVRNGDAASLSEGLGKPEPKRIGADTKGRKRSKKTAPAPAKAIPIPREWDGTMQSCSPPPRPTGGNDAMRRQGLLNRAAEAVRLAHYDDDFDSLPIDEEMREA